MGGRIESFTSGSAPISGDVLQFFRCYFGSTVTEGYGMTEVLASNISDPRDITGVGTVGPPLPAIEMRLSDVPEMNYFASTVGASGKPQGEVCFRGPTVMKGYYKEPGLTAEVLKEDGWMSSGDIGEWLPNGTLRIIDRKKNIFKLQNGEYLAPYVFALLHHVPVTCDNLRSCWRDATIEKQMK